MLRQFSIRFRLTALIVLPLFILIAVFSLMLNRMKSSGSTFLSAAQP